jgi:hypothetical protein
MKGTKIHEKLKECVAIHLGHIAFVVTKQYNQRQMEQHKFNRFKCRATIGCGSF